MKKLLALFLMCSFGLIANPYVSVGSEPSFGAGLREGASHHGLDCSVSESKKNNQIVFKGKALYLFYPHPDLESRPYFGVGPTYSKKIDSELFSKYPRGSWGSEAVVGYEFRNDGKTRVFTQLEVSNFHAPKPTVGLRVGFGF